MRREFGLRNLARYVLSLESAALEPPTFPPNVGELFDPQAQQAVEQLCSQAIPNYSSRAYLELRIQTNEDGRPTPFADRISGVPSGEADDPYRYIVAALLGGQSKAQQVAQRHAQHSGLLARHFVTIDLNKVFAVDGTSLRTLSETYLHENDPQAIRYLRAFRDAGADLVWIRGARSRRVAVLFVEAIGDSIQVVDEAPYFFRCDGERWERQSEGRSSKGRLHFSVPHRPKRVSHWSVRRTLSFIVWELLFAMVAGLLTDPLLHLFSAEIDVPLWGLLLVSMPLGWISGRALFRAIKPYKEFVSEMGSALSRLPFLVRKFEEDREFFRRLTTKLDEAELDNDDLDPLSR